MADYYRMENGRLAKVVGLVSTGTVMKNARFLTDEEAAGINAYKMANNAAEYRAGYTSRKTGVELKNGCWENVYEYMAVTHSMSDYNRALEDHLKRERVKRGYDTREPSQYINSTIDRWRQDAIDWIAHVDQVMMYGLNVINTYKSSGTAPSLENFRKSLPSIEWTIKDEDSSDGRQSDES